MFLSQALERIEKLTSENLQSLSEYLSPDIIADCLEKAGTVTIRKRRLPMDLMIWCIVGMAVFRHIPMSQIVNHLDIILPGKRAYVAPSAIVQARQRLGSEAVKKVFEQTQAIWNESTPHPNWCGLTLHGVDGIVWHTPDSPENQASFSRGSNDHTSGSYPQVRMVCQMELTSHLISGASFDCVSVNEMLLAVDLIKTTPDYSLTLFDKGFYSLGLLYEWQQHGKERHWLLPLKAGTQYKIVRKIGSSDSIVELSTTPQAKKKWNNLPDTILARLLTKTINGKKQEILTSLIDPMRYPAADIVSLYSYRWEIELGYREMKQYMLQNQVTLRSKKPEMVKQELWGILLAYNLLRFQMARMAYSVKGVEPNQISFNQAAAYIIRELTSLPAVSPGNIPKAMNRILDMAEAFILPVRRERSYPRCVKRKPQKYPTRSGPKKNASQLN